MSVQNSILYSLGCFFNLLFYFVSRKSGDTSFFYGYDNPAVGVLLFLNSTAGITISMVYKYGDAVLKTLAQPVVSAMLLFLSNFLFDMPLDIIKISGAGTVIVSTMLYMQLPAPENDALLLLHQITIWKDFANPSGGVVYCHTVWLEGESMCVYGVRASVYVR